MIIVSNAIAKIDMQTMIKTIVVCMSKLKPQRSSNTDMTTTFSLSRGSEVTLSLQAFGPIILPFSYDLKL